MADYSAGQAFLQIVPSLANFGEKVREELARENADFTVPVKPEVDPAAAAKQGDQYGGAFGDVARTRIEAALKDLPNPTIDVDSSEADVKIAELRGRLEELRDKRIGVDITADAALAEMAAIKADLDELGRKSPNIAVKVDALKAAADLAGVRAEVTALDGKNVDIKVDDQGSADRSRGSIFSLMAAGIALGPAIIPVAAAVAAALGAIGIGAIAGAAGAGTLALAFHGVGAAVSALDTANQQAGQNAAQSAARQISAANSVASAQDGVRNATRGVEDAQRSAGIAATNAAAAVATAQRGVSDAYIAAGIAQTNAAQAVATAQRGVADAYTAAAAAIASAEAAVVTAENSLASAQRSALAAQQALTDARQSAQRQLEAYANQVKDGALAERGANDNIKQAKLDLDKVLANPRSTELQREQAQLTYDTAVQQLADIQERNKNLAADKAKADAAGVEGSQQVVAAQNGVTSATQAVADAQKRVSDAVANVATVQASATEKIAVAQQALSNAQAAAAETQRANTEKIAVAEQGLATARAAQAETARAGAESITKAQESVVTADRALTAALAQQAAQAASTTAANTALATAMAKLSPTGQEFARFIALDLQPKIKALQATAQQGLLPGVETGIRAMFPIFPLLNTLVGSVASAIGDLAARAGAALTDPFWRGFIGFVTSEAGPSIRTFGEILGNLAVAGAAILEAFAPVWDQMGAGLVGLTQRFAAFSQGLSQNPAFQNFLAYVRTEGPIVVSLIGNLISAVVRIGEAMGPLGGIVLGVVSSFAQLLNSMPLGALQVLIPVLYAAYLGFTAMKIVTGIVEAFKAFQLAIAAVRDAQILATATQWLLNAAMLANPIGLVILAITALVAIIVIVVTHWQFFKDAAVACFNAVLAVAQAVWDGYLKPMFDTLMTIVGAVGNAFGSTARTIQSAWNDLGAALKTGYDLFIKPVFDSFTGIVGVIESAFATAVANIKASWDQIKDIAKAPVNFVIVSVYNGGIVPMWNDVASVFGMPYLAYATPLATGGVIPGYAPGVDDYPAILSRGEGILVPEAVRGLGAQFVHNANAYFSGGRARASSGPGFAGGGIVGDIAGFLTDPVGAATGLFSGAVATAGQIPGSGLLREALVGIPGKVIESVIAAAGRAIASAVAAAASVANTATGGLLAGGGVLGPGAVHAGPLVGVLASVRGHRYDTGGWLPPGISMNYNDTGKPEPVLTGKQWGGIEDLLSDLGERRRGDGSRRGRGFDDDDQQWGPRGLGGIHVYPSADHDEGAIADMVSRRLSFALRCGSF